ncbi:MAG TPA: protelomerase family protein [Coleofasciculaceae cyanobacterium]|jgi:integrase
MNRDEIVGQYRERVEVGARVRLTSADLEGLIQGFIDRLKGLDSQLEIDALCAAELALLEEGYPHATIAKNYIPRYRQAILLASESGALPLTEQTLLEYDYRKRNGAVGHFRGHYAYTRFKYGEEYTNIAETDNARNNLKQDNLKSVNLDRYLDRARELLASEDHNDLAVGIAAVCGRRFSEVIQHKFSKTDQPYLLRFAGQLKKRGEAEAFYTLCLIPADEVWRAIARFHRLERIQGLQGLSIRTINARMNKSVQRVVDRHFGESGIVPRLEGERATTIHNLRSVYAIAAIHLFCPPSQGEHRFLQEQLGHVIGRRDLQRLKNSGSTAHYFHYFLVDAIGRHVGAKGVLLDAVEAIALRAPGEPVARVGEADLSSLPQVSDAAEFTLPDTRFMDSLIELSNTIGFLRREAEAHKLRAEALQAERDRLVLEVEALQLRLAEVERSAQDGASEVVPLQMQVEALQLENAAYKAKLEAFGRLLSGGSGEPAIAPSNGESAIAPDVSSDSMSLTPTSPSAIAIDSPGSTALTSMAPSAIAISSPVPDGEVLPEQEGRVAISKRRPRRRSARGKLEGAVRFLQERNDSVEPDQMWAITQSIIGSLTGSNISLTVKPFWKEIEGEMERYNGDRSMDDRRQNYGRSEELPQLKEEFETWLDAQVE